MINNTGNGSTGFVKINKIYQDFEPYRLFRNGLLSKEGYAQQYQSFLEIAMQQGLTEDDSFLTARLPYDEKRWVNDALNALSLEQIDYKSLLEIRQVIYRQYYHAQRTSYIFPEEEAFMFAFIQNKRPEKAIFLGSYYGYWAAWALLADTRLRMTLIDIDEKVCDLAEENFKRLGVVNRVDIICDDGSRYMQKNCIKHDLLIIDAECPYDAAINVADRGKGIYHRLAEAALPYLSGNVICHNILTRCDTNVPYLKKKLPKNRQELKAFRALMENKGFREFEFQSTEGIGVYVKEGVK